MEREWGCVSRHAEILGSSTLQPIYFSCAYFSFLFYLSVFFSFYLLELKDKKNKMGQ